MKLYHVTIKSDSIFMTDAQEASKQKAVVQDRIQELGGTVERALGFEIAPTYLVVELPDDVDVSTIFPNLQTTLVQPDKPAKPTQEIANG